MSSVTVAISDPLPWDLKGLVQLAESSEWVQHATLTPAQRGRLAVRGDYQAQFGIAGE